MGRHRAEFFLSCDFDDFEEQSTADALAAQIVIHAQIQNFQSAGFVANLGHYQADWLMFVLSKLSDAIFDAADDVAQGRSQIVGNVVGIDQFASQRPRFDFPGNVDAFSAAVDMQILRRFDGGVDF